MRFLDPITWVHWTCLLIAWVLIFALFESLALARGGLSLSRFVYNIGQAWPLSIFLMGLVAGGLAVHFYWHWAPAGAAQGG